MNEAGVLDLEIYRGDDYVHTLYFTDTQNPPQPHDLSDFTFKAQIRDRPEMATVVLATFTVDISGAADGVIVISLNPAQTRIQPGHWDLEVSDGANTQTWLKGKVLVEGDVTQEVIA
jgi:hypothetical protein